MTSASDTLEKPRVLVVDDEVDIATTVQFCLEQEGFDVRCVGNGLEALGMVRVWQPHVVLLDVMLPGENGYRVSRFIKEDVQMGRLPPTGVMLVTARKLHDAERESTFAEFSRADHVLYKPFDLDELVQRVRALAPAPAQVAACAAA